MICLFSLLGTGGCKEACLNCKQKQSQHMMQIESVFGHRYLHNYFVLVEQNKLNTVHVWHKLMLPRLAFEN